METSQQEWKRKTLEYANAINKFVEEGLEKGWDNVGKEPIDPDRSHLVNDVLDALRKANATGELDNLRELWPPAHSPFVNILKEQGQAIPQICILPDNSIIARIGETYNEGYTVHIVNNKVNVIPDIKYFGQSPNRKYFAIARANGVQITKGWNGSEVCMCLWPTGLEGLPDNLNIKPFDMLPIPTQLIPFPNGSKVLLVSSSGIFILSPSDVKRLLPTNDNILDLYDYERKKYPDDEFSFGIDMEHAAISLDGKYIAVGSQDSNHLVFDADLNLIGDIGPQSSYPHYAVFSADGNTIAFNSCHFYNGVTISVSTDFLPGLTTEPYEEDKRTPVIQDFARVYAAVSINNEFIIGDADGYIRCFSASGEQKWQNFIGSTISAMDISHDEQNLVVSTYAGFISIIKLNAGKQAPYQIGNGNHLELRRWLFWKNESNPLAW